LISGLIEEFIQTFRIVAEGITSKQERDQHPTGYTAGTFQVAKSLKVSRYKDRYHDLQPLTPKL